MKNHTCDELGVCQQIYACHPECACPKQSHHPTRHPFAPGVIEGPERRARLEGALDVVLALGALALVCAVAGFVLGHAATRLGLLP